VIEGVRAERVAIGRKRFPVRCPAVVQRAVAVDGLLVGEEERGVNAVAAQRVGNQLRLAHAAGVERQVDGAFARAGVDTPGAAVASAHSPSAAVAAIVRSIDRPDFMIVTL